MFVLNETRTQDSWEDLQENQCLTPVAIAHLYAIRPFSLREFQEQVCLDRLSGKCENEATVDTRERTLVALRAKNLIESENGKYRLEEGSESKIVLSYYNQLDEDIKIVFLLNGINNSRQYKNHCNNLSRS
jgi:hypothetical protein